VAAAAVTSKLELQGEQGVVVVCLPGLETAVFGG
jgi:hypothetical protein